PRVAGAVRPRRGTMNFNPTKLACAALFALAAAFGAAPALAATVMAAPTDHTPQNTMLVKIDAGNSHMTERLRLSLDKAVIIELPVDTRDVLVSSPKIADAIVRTPRRIYILGLTVGQTNAFFFDGNGQQILNLEISVERDYAALEAIYAKV